MLKPKFTFVISKEYVNDDIVYTAEVLDGGSTYRVTWDDDPNGVFYDEKEIQKIIKNGIWILKEGSDENFKH